MWSLVLGIILSGYFLGCFHGSMLAQKLSGVNLKEAGSKNSGASNATIILGKKLGTLVAVIDIGKGLIAVVLLKYFLDLNGFNREIVWVLLFIQSASIILGHIFPFYMKFNGGKGTATMIGVLLAIDWRFGLLAIGLFILVSVVTDYIVFGVLVLYITLIYISVWVAPGVYPPIISAGLFLIAGYKHMENFQRIKRGEENRISSLLKRTN